MQNVHASILKASGRITPFLSVLNKTMEDFLPVIDLHLGLSNIDIVICDNPVSTIPETGMGGMAYNQNLAIVSIDPNSQNLIQNLENELRSTLAHELHHVVRWQKTGYGETLLKAIISEGLAAHFDIAINSTKPKQWDTALNGTTLSKYQKIAEVDFDNTEYNHQEWFYGTGSIPRWAGYAIGYKMVDEYIKSHEIINQKDLVYLPAKEFIK